MVPNVAILLASYNGERYITEQISSILDQRDVDVRIFVSDDGSTDDTLSIVRRFMVTNPGSVFLVDRPRQSDLCVRGAATNFCHLISSVDLPINVGWVALSDQDDLWDPVKLIRAVSLISQNSLDAYSSSVTAFWPDGKKRLVCKAGKAGAYNHLFEAPGPGCSFVLPRSSFNRLQSFLKANLVAATQIHFHDWMIYAYVRSIGGSWYIDQWPSLLYRQHTSNVIGVQLTLRSCLRRSAMLFGGWYRSQCLEVARFVGQSSEAPVRLLRRFSLVDRLRLAPIVFSNRRRLRDKLLLPLAFMVMLPRPVDRSCS